MFQSITFYIGGKTLGIYGEEFPLGALTTEVLNITPEEYQALGARLSCAERHFRYLTYMLFLEGCCSSFRHKLSLLKLRQTCCELLIAGFVILDCVEYLRADFCQQKLSDLLKISV